MSNSLVNRYPKFYGDLENNLLLIFNVRTHDEAVELLRKRCSFSAKSAREVLKLRWDELVYPRGSVESPGKEFLHNPDLFQRQYCRDFEEVLLEVFGDFLSIFREIRELDTADHVCGYFIAEMSSSKEVAYSLCSIPVGYLCEQGREHLLTYGLEWRKHIPKFLAAGSTVYEVLDTGEYF